MNKIIAIGLLVISYSVVAEDIDAFDAARTGNINAIRSYATAGGDIHARNDRGDNLFILATYYGHHDTAAHLLAFGANACAQDARGSNAFMGSRSRGIPKLRNG